MASRDFLKAAEKASERADRPRTVRIAAAADASARSGSIPPNSCRKASTGSPASTYMPSVIVRAASLPNTISRFFRSVASRNSSVCRSFSFEMVPATYPGVSSTTTASWTTATTSKYRVANSARRTGGTFPLYPFCSIE